MMRDIFLKILNNISSLRDLDVYDILYSINILSLKGLSFCVTSVNKKTVNKIIDGFLNNMKKKSELKAKSN